MSFKILLLEKLHAGIPFLPEQESMLYFIQGPSSLYKFHYSVFSKNYCGYFTSTRHKTPYYKIKIMIAVLTVVYLGGLAAREIPVKRQVDHTTLSKQDHVPAETGFLPNPAAAVHAGSKFFQYIHVPAKDHVEYGHKRGNDHHFIERHEKEHPHAGEFKAKVRWGDKHGGYGEHYWDYNHAGHDHDGQGDESHPNSEYAEYEEETKPIPVVSSLQQQTLRDKREPTPLTDVEFINDKARSLILDGNVKKHGGNYRAVNDNRGKREQNRVNGRAPRNFGQALVFNADEGVVIDEQTGLRYQLSPF